MNRTEDKEATQNIIVDMIVQLTNKKWESLPDYKITFSFKDVPVSVTDTQLKASAVDEIDNLYQKKTTLRLNDKDDKPVILDAEEIAGIKITEFIIKRGE